MHQSLREYEAKKQRKSRSFRQTVSSIMDALQQICCETQPDHNPHMAETSKRNRMAKEVSKSHAQRFQKQPGFNPFKELVIPDYVVKRKNGHEFGEDSYEFPGKSGLQGNSEASDHWFRDSDQRLSSSKSKTGSPPKDLADLIKLYNEQKSQLTPPQNSLE